MENLGNPEEELTQQQIDRQDYVDNAIYDLIVDLVGYLVPWDIAAISEIRDDIQKYYLDQYQLFDFYPWIIEEEE